MIAMKECLVSQRRPVAVSSGRLGPELTEHGHAHHQPRECPRQEHRNHLARGQGWIDEPEAGEKDQSQQWPRDRNETDRTHRPGRARDQRGSQAPIATAHSKPQSRNTIGSCRSHRDTEQYDCARGAERKAGPYRCAENLLRAFAPMRNAPSQRHAEAGEECQQQGLDRRQESELTLRLRPHACGRDGNRDSKCDRHHSRDEIDESASRNRAHLVKVISMMSPSPSRLVMSLPGRDRRTRRSEATPTELQAAGRSPAASPIALMVAREKK